MVKRKHRVFIPKYEFTIESGKAVKKISEASLSIVVESDNIQEAIFKVLIDLDQKKLKDAGYSVDDIFATEDLGDQDMRVYIKGVNKK